MQEAVWAETFKYMADNKVMFEGILLKPAMVTPGADSSAKVSPDTVASYTLKMLRRRVPPAVPGIMFLSGGQSELEATLNLNAMNQKPNPWHVSFSYARALQNSVLKSWQGKPENFEAAQQALLKRAKANSDAQLGQYDPSNESSDASQRTYEKGYKVGWGWGAAAAQGPLGSITMQEDACMAANCAGFEFGYRRGNTVGADRPAATTNTTFTADPTAFSAGLQHVCRVLLI